MVTGLAIPHLCKARAESSDTAAEAVKPDPRCSWKGHSRSVGADVGDESKESRSIVQPHCYWWSAQSAAILFLLSDEMMSCCAADTNGCLGLRRRAFPLDREMSAEWSRCPGSIARSARDSVASLRRSSAGWMPRYLASEKKGRVSLFWLTFCSRLATLLLRCKTADTLWKRWLANHRCRCWREGVQGRIPLGRLSWGVVTCCVCRCRW